MKIFDKNKAGFTMIELLVVTTIIIVLTTIGLVSYTSVNRNARDGKRKADMEMVRQALVLYRLDQSPPTYPTQRGVAAEYFDNMIDDISDYTSATEVTDPKNETTYVYTYVSADGSDFTITADLEKDGEPNYVLSNP
jgi:prepilin-type N-terminal cleavage/methylation domain-containing protein